MHRLSQNRVPISRAVVSEYLGALAARVLLAEANLTPKPGLVDQRGQGCHTDMTLALMERSACTLEPFFTEMALAALQLPLSAMLRWELGSIGRNAERAMLRSTAGVNTHKGAIWVIGLLVAAAAQLPAGDAETIAERAGQIACIPDIAQPVPLSHGEMVRLRFAKSGARGEAMSGFPHVTGVGLPQLRRSRAEGHTEIISHLNALIAIMSSLDDTCVLYRGGVEGLAVMHAGAQAVLTAGGVGTPTGDATLRALDRKMLANSLSPGGCADLLAATMLLDEIERRSRYVTADNEEK
ncbi:triphosphoribosyl-dephospho-CoA synthase [Terriglobus tenax]|uniref:triphosphoribosyl-dephospho-CoA synthase n=1 Tax=Terriglobus tenax TaxID=1111115 RepID=UPI0021DFB1F7|nr:triphosphoribosyl-dephospho-CoA synthase [Terriglobus tenax]